LKKISSIVFCFHHSVQCDLSQENWSTTLLTSMFINYYFGKLYIILCSISYV
jgi:hypothetical protein